MFRRSPSITASPEVSKPENGRSSVDEWAAPMNSQDPELLAMNPVASARVRRRASELDTQVVDLHKAAKAPGMEEIVEGEREGDIVIPKIQLSKQWREALNTLSDQLEENKLRSEHMRQRFPDLYKEENDSENSDEEFHIVDKATMSGRACGIFGPTNLVRRVAYAIMYNKPVYIFVLLLIVLNSITLALNGADQDADTKNILDLIDLVLLCFFTVEAILRVIALGLFWGSETYLGLFVGVEENPLRAPIMDDDDEDDEQFYALEYDSTKLSFWEKVRSHLRNPSLILEFLMSIRIGVNWPNLLDFVVVVAGWIELASNSDDLRAFRALRALRPLRVLKFFSGIQAILNSLIQALPLMANVLCLVTFFFVIYGILGVQSFSGALRGRCQDSSGNDIVPETFCSSLSSSCPSGFTCNEEVGNPNEGFTHFDNILWAFITIFQCVTLEAWTDNMYWAQDGAGDWSWLYFVTLIMLCSFLVLNLFVAVICASFARVREEQKSAFRAPVKKKTEEEEDMTLEEILAAQEAAEMLKEKEEREAEEKEKIEREQKSKENEFMRVYYELHDVSKKVVDNNVFNTFILLCIVLNTIFMAMEHDGMSQTFTDMLDWAEFSFSIIFLIECVVKILGLSPRVYFMHAENVFDFIIVCTTIPLILSTFGVSTVETGGLSLLRVFRLLRVMRLFRRVESLRELMKTVFLSFKSIGNLMGFIILFLCIFAFVGMQFFGGEFNFSEGFPRENFDNFGSAMLTLFIMMGGENWNAVMYNTMRVNEAIGVIYSVSFYILANFIMLNLFVAVISENFELDEEEKVKKQIEEYERWLLERSKAEEGDSTGEVNLYDRSIKGALLIKNQTQLRSKQVYGLSRDKSKQVWGKVYGWIKGPQKGKSSKTRNEAGTEEIEMNETGQAIGPRVIEMQGSGEVSEPGESGFVACEDPEAQNGQNGASAAPDEEAMKDATLLAGRQLVGQDSGMRLAGLADEQGTTHVTTAKEFGESVRKLKRRESLMSWYNIHGAHHHSNKKEYIFDKALLCLSPSNRFRIKMNKLVDSKWFELFILACIVASSILLALDSPAEDDANLDAVVLVADWIFLVVFLIEFILKITAKGIILPPGSYFSNSWNQLDFFVLVVTILAQVNLAGDNGKVLRILRTLRPLRMINKSPGMQIIIKALLQGLPSILNVVALMVFFFLVYGILGVQQFAGLYRTCNDGGDTISTKADCTGNFENDESVLVPRVWGNPSYASLAFDDIFGAFRTLFEVSSLEGWLDVMYSAQDITGSDEQPSRNSRWWNAIFFVTFIFLGSFFMLQLFVGVLIYSFDKVGGSALLTDTQKQWLDMKRLMDHSKPAKESFRPKNRCQGFIFNIVMNPRFDRFIMTCIIVNTVFMASEFYGMPKWWSLTLDIVNYIFLAIFTVEAILKLLALDYRYFKSGWNVFDFVVVLGSYIGLILGSSGGQVARIFRLGRIIRLIQRAKGLRMLFNTLVISLPSIINISSLLFLLFFIYAVIGTQLFALVKYSGEGGIANRANFRNFPNSMLLLFRMATGENWQLIMAACLIDKDECTQVGERDDCPAEQWMTYPYFFSFYMIGAYVFVNLFIATILSNFDNCYNREESDITAEDIRIFKIAWRKIHTMYKMPEKDHLPLWKLQEFVDMVGPPLGFKTDENRWRFRLIYEELRSGVRAGRENLPPAHPRRGPKYRDVLHTLAMHRMSLSSLKYIDRTIREEALLDLQRKDAQRKIGASVRGYLERKLLLAEVSQLLSGPSGGASRPASRNGAPLQASERSRQAAEELSMLVNSENTLKGTFNGTSPEMENVIEVQYSPNPDDVRAPPPTSSSTGLLSAFRSRKK